ncbi:MAG: tetraether lipid synthase Tes [Nitrososphaeria archaeon]
MEHLKYTRSLCPVCLKVIRAELFVDDNTVYIKKKCEEHGDFEDIYMSDYKWYKKVQQYERVGEGLRNPRTLRKVGCPFDCGICDEHRSQTLLGIIDVTNACNLKCPICFANAAAVGYLYQPSLEVVKSMLDNLRSNMPVPTYAVQFSGGEPTLRDDLPEMIRYAGEIGIPHVEVNTNGVRIARDKDYLRELIRAGVSTFYLSFDSLTRDAYLKMKGADLLGIKLQALQNIREAGLQSVVLVPTVVKGVNDNEIGALIEFGVKNCDIVRCVNFQPVSFAGRIEASKLREFRVTTSDVINNAETQTNGKIRMDDWYPIPFVAPISDFIAGIKGVDQPTFTVHQNCGAATFLITKDGGDYEPITRQVEIEKFVGELSKAAKALHAGKRTRGKLRAASALRHVSLGMSTSLVRGFLSSGTYESLGKFMRKIVMVGDMHFMDPYNFDLERVERCGIHYATPDGRIIPFCSMNTLHRPNVEQTFSTPLGKRV